MLYFSTDLWGCGETAVEKPVENVENCEFPTDIFSCGKFSGLCKKCASDVHHSAVSEHRAFFCPRRAEGATGRNCAKKVCVFPRLFSTPPVLSPGGKKFL